MEELASPKHHSSLLADASFPADDRGLMYGDSLFETMLCREGVVLLANYHQDRLQLGAERLDFSLDVAQVMRDVQSRAKSLEGSYVLRLTVTRGSGPRGYTPPVDSELRTHLSKTSVSEMSDPGNPLNLICADIRLPEQPALAEIKHGSRLEQVLAAAEASRSGVDAALMLSSQGNVQCLSNANIFAVLDGVLYTPDCSRCGVAGTRRRFILERVASQMNLRCVVKEISVDDLLSADGAFATNAVHGPREIASIDGHALSRWDGFAHLHLAYFKLINA